MTELTEPTELFILDPRPPKPADDMVLAPRLDTLDGATIALVHNGKTHGRELMLYVIKELSQVHNIAGVVHVEAPSPGYGGDPDDVPPIAARVMAAISAVGD